MRLGGLSTLIRLAPFKNGFFLPVSPSFIASVGGATTQCGVVATTNSQLVVVE